MARLAVETGDFRAHPSPGLGSLALDTPFVPLARVFTVSLSAKKCGEISRAAIDRSQKARNDRDVWIT